MFFPFLLVSSIAIGLVQLGALSVWVAVLAMSLKVVLLLAVIVALYFGLRSQWRRYRANRK